MTKPSTRSSLRVMIAGGSGMIGRHVCSALIARGDEVLVLSREPRRREWLLPGCGVLHWCPGAPGRWRRELDAVDALIDLSGAPFFTKWRGDYYTREVFGSRLRAICALVDAIEAARVRPKVFISTSSLGCYGFRRTDQVLSEDSNPDLGALSQDVVRLETLALDAADLGTRVVLPRPGFVLAPDGGAFGRLLPMFARGNGRAISPGTQWCSWIHVDDAVALIVAAVDDHRVRGPLNLTAPSPVRNDQFAEALARAVGRPLRPPVPGRLVHLKFGKAALTVTHGPRVLPVRALELGYGFRYPQIDAALADLVTRNSIDHSGVLRESTSSSSAAIWSTG